MLKSCVQSLDVDFKSHSNSMNIFKVDVLKNSNSVNSRLLLNDKDLLKDLDRVSPNNSQQIEMTDLSEFSDSSDEISTISNFPCKSENAAQIETNKACLQRVGSLRSRSLKRKPQNVECCDETKLIKPCSIRCLESMESLQEKCEDLDLYFNDGKAYEVDLIIDDKIEDREKYYLVKWKNYSLKDNTWEPIYHLDGCETLVSFYDSLKRSVLTTEMVQYFIKDLVSRKPYDILTLRKVYKIITNKSAVDYEVTTSEMKRMAKKLLDKEEDIVYSKKKLLEIMKLSELRKQVLINLHEWEIEINTYIPTSYVTVENDVDLETAPTGFQFMNDYMYTDVELPVKATVAFCNCDNCFDSKITCCPEIFDTAFPYTRNRRLTLRPGYPIYECNDLCKCGPDCPNRVVQHGSSIKFAIFRTSNGRGWGLKTLEPIQKNQFVLEYLGEIITSESAEERGLIHDYIGKSYLFDLDYGDNEECKYTVDACHVGNASHFINHSCNPNLCVYAVWINQQNPLLPRLAFFSKRSIARGEELTFDYKMVNNRDEPVAQPREEFVKIPCLCQSKNCRKFMN